jgi:hypothetical protein
MAYRHEVIEKEKVPQTALHRRSNEVIDPFQSGAEGHETTRSEWLV